MIKAVLCDMDGVIFDTERIYADAVPAIAKELGYTMDMAFFVKTLGISNRECRRLYAEAYGDGFPFDRAADMLFDFILDYNQKHTMPLKAGVMECLQGLQDRGLPIVLATSSPRFVVDELFASMPTLDMLFFGKVCGDEVQQGKPEPENLRKGCGARWFPARGMRRCGRFAQRPDGHPRGGRAAGDGSRPHSIFRRAQAIRRPRAGNLICAARADRYHQRLILLLVIQNLLRLNAADCATDRFPSPASPRNARTASAAGFRNYSRRTAR